MYDQEAIRAVSHSHPLTTALKNRWANRPGSRGFPLLGILVIGLCLSVTLLAGILGVPHEDSAILYSYSHNLATSGTISYYPGGPRAEGATDFGWMVMIAGLQLVGIPNHLAAALLNVAAIILVALRVCSISQANGQNQWAAWINPTAIFCAILYLSAAATSGLWGFSSLTGACLLAIIFLSLASGQRDRWLLSTSLAFLLLRPDSVAYWLALNLMFAAAPSLSADWRSPVRCLRRSATAVALTFTTVQVWLPLLTLAIYWIARAAYFQDFFPLPFYIKAESVRSPLELASRFISELNATRITRLTLLLLSLSILSYSYLTNQPQSQPQPAADPSPTSRSSTILISRALLAALGFFLAQAAILSRFALIQNIGDRFHVPGLAIAASLAAFIQYQLSQASASEIRLRWLTQLAYASTAAVGCIGIYGIRFIPLEYKLLFTERRVNSIIRIAESLRHTNKTYGINRLYVTEAGWLTYYSKAPTLDAWGLNTAAYAKRPLVDPATVLKDKPDLIFIHSPRFIPPKASLAELKQPQQSQCSRLDGCTWGDMVNAIYVAAESLNYDEYVVPQRQARFLFLVSPDAKGRTEIINSLLREHAVKVSRSTVSKALDGAGTSEATSEGDAP